MSTRRELFMAMIAAPLVAGVRLPWKRKRTLPPRADNVVQVNDQNVPMDLTGCVVEYQVDDEWREAEVIDLGRGQVRVPCPMPGSKISFRLRRAGDGVFFVWDQVLPTPLTRARENSF